MGHKISKEQIDPGVKDYIMSFVGDINELETDDKSNIINAVNSLMVDRVDNAENMGKLANAIGEPVTANHSVDEAVEGLGELLSTFKTNMMNSGVIVESGDKFKALIDKIATMSGSGSGLDIISVNELPATGRENRIYVITDTTPNKFIVTTNYQDTTDDTNIALYLSNTASHDWISTCIPMVNGNVQMNYYVHKLMQGDKRLPAYIYRNNQWDQIAYEYFAIMENGVYYNNDLHGGFKGDGTVFNVEEGTGITFMGTWTSENSYYMFSTNTPIDFNQFTKLKLTTHSLNGVTPNLNWAIISILATGNSVSKKDTHGYSFNNGGWTVPYTIRRIPFSATPTEVEYDISDWQGTYYITFECELPSSSYGIPIIDDIKLY